VSLSEPRPAIRVAAVVALAVIAAAAMHFAPSLAIGPLGEFPELAELAGVVIILSIAAMFEDRLPR
jgi:hypothetical protein